MSVDSTKNEKELDGELSFEEAMKRLEDISNTMTSGNFTLDETIELYSQGIKLIAFCREKLDCAERKIKIVTDKFTGETADYKGE